MALLSKMAWRLIQNPNAYWARILKAIYFPRCTIKEAKKGARASWAWTSLLAGRDVLMDNGMWKIGNGQSVNVFGDAWIPGLPKFRLNVMRPLAQEHASRMVSDLIDVQRTRWLLTPIQAEVDEDQLNAIRRVPISMASEDDRFIWPHSKTGELNVSSAYRQIIGDSADADCVPMQNMTGYPPLKWKEIWSMCAIPKVRTFMWKLHSNALAVNYNLCRRGVLMHSTCPFCEGHETVEHMITQCAWTRLIWFALLSLRQEDDAGMSMGMWVSKLRHAPNLGKKDRSRRWSLIGLTCWNIWKERCRALHEHEEPNPRKLIETVRRDYTEYWNAQSVVVDAAIDEGDTLNPTAEDVNSRPNHEDADNSRIANVWVAPSMGIVKINCDAAWDEQTQRGGIGGLARTENGMVLGGFCSYGGRHGILELEIDAIATGVELAISNGWMDVILESDSKEAIRSITGNDKQVDWRIITQVKNIRDRSSCLHSVNWSWIPREANGCANWIAIQARKRSCPSDWVAIPPPSLLSLLIADMGFVPP